MGLCCICAEANMTIDDIKAVNDTYIANEKRKAVIERAKKKVDGYQVMK